MLVVAAERPHPLTHSGRVQRAPEREDMQMRELSLPYLSMRLVSGYLCLGWLQPDGACLASRRVLCRAWFLWW